MSTLNSIGDRNAIIFIRFYLNYLYIKWAKYLSYFKQRKSYLA